MRRVVFIAAVAIAAVFALAVGTLVVMVASGSLKLYAISSSAMEPTLHCARPGPGCEAGMRDRVLALTRFVSIERGDLVVFRAPPRAQDQCGTGGTFIKRLIGLPGETVELRLVDGAAHAFVDGRKLDEPYLEDDRRDPGPGARYAIPDDHVFVLGDYRAQSCDSSVFGPVSEDDLVGEVVGTYWPPGRIAIR